MGLRKHSLAVFLLATSLVESSVCERPKYLTSEDFVLAKTLTALPLNHSMNLREPIPPVQVRVPKSINTNLQWPGARVYYTLDSRLSSSEKAEVAKAFSNYQDNTCILFIPRLGQRGYVDILKDDGVCGVAQLGYTGRASWAKFGGPCITSSLMTHELGHTLGYGHEQNRDDRDSWIDWDTSKCQPQPKDGNDFSTLDLLYDYVSIEHYEGECYNGCIKPKIPGVTKCGSGGTLSVLDIEKFNAAYECGGCLSYRFRPVGKSAGENRVETGTTEHGETLYPCRGYHNGDIIPGNSNGKACWVGYGGQEWKLEADFEILTNPKNASLRWSRRPEDGSVPKNAIRGGRSAERETLYIGRCTLFANEGHPHTTSGKVQVSVSKDLIIGYGGREYFCSDFDYLVCDGWWHR